MKGCYAVRISLHNIYVTTYNYEYILIKYFKQIYYIIKKILYNIVY